MYRLDVRQYREWQRYCVCVRLLYGTFVEDGLQELECSLDTPVSLICCFGQHGFA